MSPFRIHPNLESPMKRSLLSLALLAAIASPIQAATPIAETRAPLDARGELEVSNVRGRISVTAWDRAEVGWSGSLGADAKLVVEKSASRVSLRVESENGSSWLGWNRGPREDSVLVIRVPASAALDLSAVSANIDVTAMRASAGIEAESVSGDVTLKAVRTDKLDLSSVSGDVSFEGEAQRADVETVSGDVHLSGASGEISVESVSGNAEVRVASIREFEGSSVSGDIDFDGDVAAGGRLDVESMSGDIGIMLPAGVSARVSAESFSGRLDNEFGLAVEDEEGPGSSMRGKLGDGSATIEIESFSGDVRLRKR